MADEPNALIRSFAGQPVLDNTRVGRVEGARELRDFGPKMAGWLRKRYTVAEHVAITHTPIRTVEEVVLHLLGVRRGQGRVAGSRRDRPQPRPHEQSDTRLP